MIRVLVVDDSIVVQKLLTRELGQLDGIEVVGAASDPFVARELIAKLAPDVLTLDLEMPRMDGLTFLEKLMRHHPMRVVVVSSLATEGGDNAVRALALGALELVSKPSSQFSIPDVRARLGDAIRAAAASRLQPPAAPTGPRPPSGGGVLSTTVRVLAIGASTGGPRALEEILPALPSDGPATVVVQHMPADFTGAFASRLDRISAMNIREARDGDPVRRGTALIAPGGRHMRLVRSGAHYSVRLDDAPAVQHHRPSVDVLFESVAKSAGANAMGVLLTGMGADGARGLCALRAVGARTVAQDEASSVVYGMPRVAVEMGAAEQVLPLPQIADAAMRWAIRPRSQGDPPLVSARRA